MYKCLSFYPVTMLLGVGLEYESLSWLYFVIVFDNLGEKLRALSEQICTHFSYGSFGRSMFQVYWLALPMLRKEMRLLSVLLWNNLVMKVTGVLI